MMNKLLDTISPYAYSSKTENLAHALLKPMHTWGIGKVYQVVTTQNSKNKHVLHQETQTGNTALKVASVVLFPLTLLSTAFGLALQFVLTFSARHQRQTSLPIFNRLAEEPQAATGAHSVNGQADAHPPSPLLAPSALDPTNQLQRSDTSENDGINDEEGTSSPSSVASVSVAPAAHPVSRQEDAHPTSPLLLPSALDPTNQIQLPTHPRTQRSDTSENDGTSEEGGTSSPSSASASSEAGADGGAISPSSRSASPPLLAGIDALDGVRPSTLGNVLQLAEHRGFCYTGENEEGFPTIHFHENGQPIANDLTLMILEKNTVSVQLSNNPPGIATQINYPERSELYFYHNGTLNYIMEKETGVKFLEILEEEVIFQDESGKLLIHNVRTKEEKPYVKETEFAV
jgi:hypothetical protein